MNPEIFKDLWIQPEIMNLASATLVTTEVEPGWQLTSDGVEVGKRYIVNLDLLCWMTMINKELGRSIRIACIWVVAPGPPGWLPIMAFGMRCSDE